MNRTISFRLFAPLLIAAVLAIAVIGLVRQAPAIEFDSPFGGRTRTAPIDTEVAAEQSALRW